MLACLPLKVHVLQAAQREKHLADSVRMMMIVDSVESDTKKADALFEAADADK